VAHPESNLALGLTYGLAGRKGEARRILEYRLARRKEQYMPATQIALVYGGLGEWDEGFSWLSRSFDERGWLMDEMGATRSSTSSAPTPASTFS
jgi:hypothetical protein